MTDLTKEQRVERRQRALSLIEAELRATLDTWHQTPPRLDWAAAIALGALGDLAAEILVDGTMSERLPTDVVEARLNHLIDRARRGALLPEEADRFTTELRDLVRRLEDEEDTSCRLLAQRQEMAEERHTWEKRGDKAEAAIERVRKLATQWAVLRTYGGAAYELRKALDEKPAKTTSLAHQSTEQQASDLAGVDEPALGQPQQPTSISPTAALLATNCDACRHTLNWHRNDVGCTVPLCVCSQFQQPTA